MQTYEPEIQNVMLMRGETVQWQRLALGAKTAFVGGKGRHYGVQRRPLTCLKMAFEGVICRLLHAKRPLIGTLSAAFIHGKCRVLAFSSSGYAENADIFSLTFCYVKGTRRLHNDIWWACVSVAYKNPVSLAFILHFARHALSLHAVSKHTAT